jgi:hypothetical protein
LYVHDLCELEISGIGGEETRSGGVGGGHADLRVDIEHTFGAAGRPDDGSAVGFVVLEVVTAYGTDKVILGGGLFTVR